MKNAQNGNKVRLKHLHVFKTRHGKTKIYFRKPGQKAVPIVSERGTPEFHAEYTAALNNAPRPSIGIEKRNNADGTWNAAIALYIGSSAYTSLARPEAYRATIAYLRQKVGDLPMRDFKPYMIKELVDGLVKDGKTGAANTLSVVTRKAIEIALEREWITIDLAKGLPKKQAQKNKEGYRPWTEDEVTQWRAFYPDHASMPRRAFELIYATGMRGRSDATRIAWKMKDGGITMDRAGTLWLSYIPEKTKRLGKRVTLPLIDSDLLACLAHYPLEDELPLLREKSGKPYTVDHFSYDWRRWAKAAGMASDFTPHGARKAIAKDAFEMDVSVDDGAKVTAHSPAMFRFYGLAASEKIATGRAMEKIVSGRRKRGSVEVNLQTLSSGLQTTGKTTNEIKEAA